MLDPRRRDAACRFKVPPAIDPSREVGIRMGGVLGDVGHDCIGILGLGDAASPWAGAEAMRRRPVMAHGDKPSSTTGENEPRQP